MLDLLSVMVIIVAMRLATEIDFDPRREIFRRVRRRKAVVGNVTGAIARRDVQAAAESNRQMCVVAANAVALHVRFERSSGGARVLVAEGQMVVYEIADGLHPRPAERRMSEQAPGLVGQAIGLAVAAAQQ